MNPKAEIIVRECAEKHGVTVERVIAYCNRKNVVRARHEAMYRIRHELMPAAPNPLAYSYPAIGRIFGGRHHSTVIGGIEMHKKRLAGHKSKAGLNNRKPSAPRDIFAGYTRWEGSNV